MLNVRVGYVALVSARSTIQTKVDSQKQALVRMLEGGSISGLTMTNCVMDDRGDDLVQFGDQASVRLRRSGRGHSFLNLFVAYPQIYRAIERGLLSSGVGVVYIRKPAVFGLAFVGWLRRLRRKGLRVILEIPTFPYDRELRPGSLLQRMDGLARRRLVGAVDLIATFSEDESIFGVPCVRVLNCVSVHELPLSRRAPSSGGIRFTCVSALEPWHRLDRLLASLIGCWDEGDARVSILNIVGSGPALSELMDMVAVSPLSNARVVFHGPVYGEELSAIFDETDLAVGNLEVRSDRGLESVQALKHREYAARGVPFIYGLSDWSFANSAYALQVPEGDICLDFIVDWYSRLAVDGVAIRRDALRFRWEAQFEAAFQALDELGCPT